MKLTAKIPWKITETQGALSPDVLNSIYLLKVPKQIVNLSLQNSVRSKRKFSTGTIMRQKV